MKEEDYIKGYNASYLMSQYEPQLLTELLSTMEGRDDYENGFIDGREQYNLEIEQKELDELHAYREQQDLDDRDIDIE